MSTVVALVVSDGIVAQSTAAGQTLAQALQSLQRRGLPLIYSNALVKPDYRVSGPPKGDEPLTRQAERLLAPFGLRLERSGEVFYVVRAAPMVASPPGAPVPAPPAKPVIEEVIVSSPRYELVRDAHQQRRLGERELAVLPSIGRDPLRTVSLLPGQASVGVSARSHMRGGDSNEVLYLIDGVEIIEPFHLGDFHALFSAVNPGLVDSVDVYHAGFPAGFGSRLSGVIDIELGEPERPFQGQLNLDLVSAAAQAQGYHGAMQWLVSARRGVLDYLLDHLERDYGKPKFHDELIRVAWDTADTSVTLGILNSNDELTLLDAGGGETARGDYHNTAAWLKASRTLNDALEVRLAGTYTVVDNMRRGRLDDPSDASGELAEARDFKVYGLRTGLSWQLAPRWTLDFGVAGQQQDGDFEVALDTTYGPLGDPLQQAGQLQRNVSARRDGTLAMAYVSVAHAFNPAIGLELGLRFDMQDIDPVHDRQFSPRLQLSLQRGAWRGFVNAGRYTQYQNLYELQLDDGLLELQNPQISHQLSIGADWSAMAALRLRAELYWRDVDDPWSRFENLYNRWVLLPELHADRLPLGPSQVRIYGGELVLDYRPRDTLELTVSYALAHARERIDGSWRRRPWEQRRSVQAAAIWQPGAWRIGATVSHHTGWPTTSRLTAPPQDARSLYDTNLPSYFSLDLHVAREISLPQSQLELYLDVSNATSASNVGGYRYPLRNGVFVADERRLLPLVPVLGVSWTW